MLWFVQCQYYYIGVQCGSYCCFGIVWNGCFQFVVWYDFQQCFVVDGGMYVGFQVYVMLFVVEQCLVVFDVFVVLYEWVDQCDFLFGFL